MGAIPYSSKFRQGGQKVNHAFFLGNTGRTVLLYHSPVLGIMDKSAELSRAR